MAKVLTQSGINQEEKEKINELSTKIQNLNSSQSLQTEIKIQISSQDLDSNNNKNNDQIIQNNQINTQENIYFDNNIQINDLQQTKNINDISQQIKSQQISKNYIQSQDNLIVQSQNHNTLQPKYQEIQFYTNSFINNNIKDSDLQLYSVKIGKLIGEGAYGQVYEGMISKTGQFIAVKTMTLKPKIDDIAPLKITSQEVEVLKKLDHQNIVKYLGCKQEGDCIHVFMEHMQGGSLTQMLQQYGKFEETLIKKFVQQIVNGLEYLHGENIIHRDLKGANLLTDKHGNVKLADFGAARQVENIAQQMTESEQDLYCKSIKGSIRWLAPEILNGEPHGFKIDIWSLGCTIIEMATANPPWNYCKSLPQLIIQVMTKKCPPIPEFLSDNCQDFIKQCCTFEKNLRPKLSQLKNHIFLKN